MSLLLMGAGSAGVAAVAAKGYVTFLNNPGNGELIDVGDAEYQFVRSAGGPADVLIADSPDETAINLATVINNDSGGALCTATTDDVVVTLTAIVPGEDGNSINLASDSVQLELTAFSGGSG